MMIKKAVTIVAATLLASVSLTGMASAQPTIAPGHWVFAVFGGQGPTQAAAIQAATASATAQHCNTPLANVETNVQPAGTWWAQGSTWCYVVG
ncbi:hypothetical protein P3T36_004242 [Kitasatospora sp. MAP12-15]|uniref:hypothetical protein n=1 Tax=unclassified Kitasatospora TaxID=2633591 RepID=UPI00247694D5|nr:hypothetical protein [Kitasatospora sp. MAP12-44]MDH6108293.1 hypothetical protein [Kitasatospora sp. MAP12-44]